MGSSHKLTSLNQARLDAFADNTKGTTIVYGSIDRFLQTAIALADTVRKEAKNAVAQIHSMGIDTIMLTGDHEPAAHRVRQRVGVQKFEFEQKPGEKLAWIEGNTHKKNILMVGDGINDGPSLAAAKVGVAMGAGGTALAVRKVAVF